MAGAGDQWADEPSAVAPASGRNALESVRGVRAVELPSFVDARGVLVPIEFSDTFPFTVRRAFIITDVPVDARRGHHAHKRCEQFFVCVRGSCTVVVDDGRARASVGLERPHIGLHLASRVWAELHSFSRDATVVVFASEHYDEADYIADYDEFVEETARGA